jgi:hypothetical protein
MLTYDSFNEGLTEVGEGIPRLKEILNGYELKKITEDETIMALTSYVRKTTEAREKLHRKD